MRKIRNQIINTLAALFSLLATTRAAAAPPHASFQDGDLIFHQSQTAQSRAIKEATGSPWTHVGLLFKERNQWYVVEAVQPVRVTKLSTFTARGLHKDYQVYRVRNMTTDNVKALREELKTYLGKDYDIYFEWSDDRTYCSELVYKPVYKITGIEIGELQKYRDLKLDGPYVQAMIKQRLTDTGRTLNLDEPIVTPVSQMNDPDLDLIYKSSP